MRFFALFLMLAGTLAAEFGFITGQGARLVIGQETFTAQEPGATATLLGGVGGVAWASDTLFVADSNRVGALPLNHRVLQYNNISAKWPAPEDVIPQVDRCPLCLGTADVVLGHESADESEQKAPTASTLRGAVGVATDGVRVAVADTDNNRVLIWNTLPSSNGQPADLVLGQKGFDSNTSNGFQPTRSSLKGPLSVWLMRDGSLWVADTGNNRVLKWNHPTQNGQDADLVLGAPDFTTFVQPDVTQENPTTDARSLLDPSSVSSDGQRLIVSDLGNNRVLIYNTLPTENHAPADIVLGQPDMESRTSNNSQALCEPTIEERDNGTGEVEEVEVFPIRCAATMNFPRFAISDGEWFFVADGGNDRVLVYNKFPTENGARADTILGQINEFVNNTSDSAFPNDIASAGVIRTPHSLAWDGRDLYVADPFNRRVLVFTAAETMVAGTGVRNAASFEVFASGLITLSGEIGGGEDAAEDFTEEVTATIQDEREYVYKVQKEDTFAEVTTGLAAAINEGEGDPEVFALPNPGSARVILTAKTAGKPGNDIRYAAKSSEGSKIIVTTASGTLDGGEDASQIAPYTIVSIVGENLSDTTMAADLNQETLPDELGGVQVYFDGLRAPLYFVSPTQINAQIPVEVRDAQGINAYVRTEHNGGEVVATNVVAVPIVQFNPGLFAGDGKDPRPAVGMHSSSHATGIVSVDGTAKANDVATVIIDGRRYEHTITEEEENAVECPSDCEEGDENCTPPESCFEKLVGGQRAVMNSLIELINNDPAVEARASTQFARIRLRARVEGPEGNGITYQTETSENSGIILTATTTELCCANVKGAPLTADNPALPGETIVVWGTGLGLVEPEEATDAMITGAKYRGPEANKPIEFVSSLVGGLTANVLSCGLEPGTFGLYRCDLQLNQGLPTNARTGVTIAQGFNVSNIVTIPVFNPSPPLDATTPP